MYEGSSKEEPISVNDIYVHTYMHGGMDGWKGWEVWKYMFHWHEGKFIF